MTAPTTAGRTRRPPRSRAQRRSGYVGTIVVDAILLLLINRWPGWAVLPFLTAGMSQVLPWINASLLVGMAFAAVSVLADPPWLRALGTLATAVIGLGGVVRMWQVFPFDFTGSAVDWTGVVRILLVLGIIGAGIGVVAALVALVVALVRGPARPVPGDPGPAG